MRKKLFKKKNKKLIESGVEIEHNDKPGLDEEAETIEEVEDFSLEVDSDDNEANINSDVDDAVRDNEEEKVENPEDLILDAEENTPDENDDAVVPENDLQDEENANEVTEDSIELNEEEFILDTEDDFKISEDDLVIDEEIEEEINKELNDFNLEESAEDILSRFDEELKSFEEDKNMMKLKLILMKRRFSLIFLKKKNLNHYMILKKKIIQI